MEIMALYLEHCSSITNVFTQKTKLTVDSILTAVFTSIIAQSEDQVWFSHVQICYLTLNFLFNKISMFKYFAKFGVIVHRNYQYHTFGYSSTTTDKK